MSTLTRALACLIVLPVAATAQPPAAKPADTKPAVKPADQKKEEPKPAPADELTDVKSFVLSSEAEYTDTVQQFGTLYAQMGAKPSSPGQPATAPKPLKFTPLGRCKAVLVRGTEAELELAEAVVKVIQGGTPGGAGPAVIKLKNTNVQEVLQATAVLELDAGLVPLRGSNSLVLLDQIDPAASQVKKVIEACEKVEPKAVKPPVSGGD